MVSRRQDGVDWQGEWDGEDPPEQETEPPSDPSERPRDWVLDLGLEPPSIESCAAVGAWREWWWDHCRDMEPWQREKLWEAMDRVHPYTIVEVELDEAGEAPEEEEEEEPPPMPTPGRLSFEELFKSP
jgi:hypothetical protein